MESGRIASSDLKFHPSHIVDMIRESWIQGKFKKQKNGALLAQSLLADAFLPASGQLLACSEWVVSEGACLMGAWFLV